MDGPVVWPQLAWIAGLVGASAVFGAILTLWFSNQTRQDRHEIRAHYDQHISLLEEKIEHIEDSLIIRVHAIELQNASTMVILKHIDSYKEEINDKLDQIQKDRREDMVKINSMMASLHNRILP